MLYIHKLKCILQWSKKCVNTCMLSHAVHLFSVHKEICSTVKWVHCSFIIGIDTHLTAFNLKCQFCAIQSLYIQSPAFSFDVKWLRDLMAGSCFGKIVTLGTNTDIKTPLDKKNSTLYLRYGCTSSDWQLMFQETYGCPLKTMQLHFYV